MTEESRKRNEIIIDAIRRMQEGERARMSLDLLGWNYCDEKRKAAVLDELEELNEAVESAEEAEVVFWGYADTVINKIVRRVNIEFGYALDCMDCCQLLKGEVLEYLYRIDISGCDNFFGTCEHFLRGRLIEYLGLELSCGIIGGKEYRKMRKGGILNGGRMVYFFSEYSEEDNEDEDGPRNRLPEQLVISDPSEEILGSIDRERMRKTLREVLQRMPAEERRLIDLRFYKGLKPAEIKKELGYKHISTVTRKLDRALKDVIRMLNEAGELEGMRNYLII